MKSFLTKSLVVATGLVVMTSALSYAASPPTPQLTKSDKPLVDLGVEVGGPSMKSYTPPVKKAEPASLPKVVDLNGKSTDAKKTVMAPEMPGENWQYRGETGPRHWADLSPENIQCKAGKNQSPIDLRSQHGVGTVGLAELDIRYRDVPLKVINTGKTLQVNYPLGSYIKVGGHRYELMNFHFHTPSEHMKEGFHYPMEVQLVHRDGDGNVAMIAVIFQEGEENEHLQVLLDHLPKEINKQEIHRGANLNPVMFFPGNTDFFKYSGSLTTPPCSEGVYWMVFNQTIEASAEQIQQMNEVMGENARPIQKIYSRTLLKSWAEQVQEPQMYEYY